MEWHTRRTKYYINNRQIQIKKLTQNMTVIHKMETMCNNNCCVKRNILWSPSKLCGIEVCSMCAMCKLSIFTFCVKYKKMPCPQQSCNHKSIIKHLFSCKFGYSEFSYVPTYFICKETVSTRKFVFN